jgi:hypothetical protein
MTDLNALGLSSPRLSSPDGPVVERIIIRRPLQRVLAFLGVSIDEVCNDALTKSMVYGYFKLHKQVNRSMEITELEQQWNPAGMSGR